MGCVKLAQEIANDAQWGAREGEGRGEEESGEDGKPRDEIM